MGDDQAPIAKAIKNTHCGNIIVGGEYPIQKVEDEDGTVWVTVFQNSGGTITVTKDYFETHVLWEDFSFRIE